MYIVHNCTYTNTMVNAVCPQKFVPKKGLTHSQELISRQPERLRMRLGIKRAIVTSRFCSSKKLENIENRDADAKCIINAKSAAIADARVKSDAEANATDSKRKTAPINYAFPFNLLTCLFLPCHNRAKSYMALKCLRPSVCREINVCKGALLSGTHCT